MDDGGVVQAGRGGAALGGWVGGWVMGRERRRRGLECGAVGLEWVGGWVGGRLTSRWI